MKRIRDNRWWMVALAVLTLVMCKPCFAEETDADTWDFGQIKQGMVVTHTFTLKNESSKPLNIVSVNTSCGCTVSEVKKKVLVPQESTALDVKFNSKGYSGAVQQFVYVNTDDLDKPIVRFIIKANVTK